MALRTAKYVTLVSNTERVVDLLDSGAGAWPSTITILNRGPSGGMFEVAVAVEMVAGAIDIDQEPATLPLAACPTDGAYLVPAVVGASITFSVAAHQDGSDLKVHLYSTGAAVIGIIAEGS